MADPSTRTTVTIGDDKFNALAVQMGITTLHDHHGMPQMGSMAFSISVTVDMHDTENMKFTTINNLFNLANGVTHDKIKDIKIEYWQDEQKVDALCVYSFSGWISSFFTISGEHSNHMISMTLQPELNDKQFAKIALSN
jgi:hypothetical protein